MPNRKVKTRNACALGLAVGLWLFCPVPVSAQHCAPNPVAGALFGFTPLVDPDPTPQPNVCNLLPCHKPKTQSPIWEITPQDCDGDDRTCTVRLRVPLELPGNSQLPTNGHARVFWFNQAKTQPQPSESTICLPGPDCNPVTVCGGLGAEILSDFGETWVQVSGTCADVARISSDEGNPLRTYSVSAYACLTSTGECTQRLDVEDLLLTPPLLWNLFKCGGPPPESCDDWTSCPNGDTSVGTGPPEIIVPLDGSPAQLRYKGGAAGHPDFPGTPDWNLTLGRYWSHAFAERIVPDPDDSHVWLITRFASFHEFEDLSGGVYQSASPSSEYRKLHRTATGWTLNDLDGTILRFDGAGRWVGTVDRHGNETVATYAGTTLTLVGFPDGRSASFGYHADGKLATVTEIGVDGVTSRAWRYTWQGLDLVRIDRPDGTAWSLRYDDPRHPGSITRVRLVGTDGSERVERAWQYDDTGNAVRSWRGAESFEAAAAVDRYSYHFDNPLRPTLTDVTDPLGNVTTYHVGRDPKSVKPRVTRISGGCSTCGSGAETRRFFDDPANPLKVTRRVDAGGDVTLFGYSANGRLTSRTEAPGTALERTTDWEYDPTIPSLVTAILRPSTSGTGQRRESWQYDAASRTVTRVEEGIEGGSAFSYTSVTQNNEAGRPLYTDPPGYGTDDRTSFSYDPQRGDLIAISRFDPLVGITTFGYDPLNRQNRVTEPNGNVIETTYDELDRVLTVTERGATSAEDLVTTHVYTPFGELDHTVFPRGNVVAFVYDEIGRLVSVERKSNLATPGERTLFTLDSQGRRIREERQSWNGAGWDSETVTDFVYSKAGCPLEKIVSADGSATEFAYDCQGRLEQEWDAAHPSNDRQNPPSKVYTYDDLGRLSSVTRPWGGAGEGSVVTRYEYDTQDHLVRVVDAAGTVTRYTFSDRDLLTETTSEVSATTRYVYNEHRQLTHVSDARGSGVTFTVDAADRVVFEDLPGVGDDVAYGYGAAQAPFSAGRLTAISRHGESVEYGYDRFGRLIRDGVLGYGYDENGNLTTIDYPGGVTASYTYDFAERPASLSVGEEANPPRPIVTAARYLPSGPLTRLDLGNGLQETRLFTSRYRPESIEVPGRLSWTYSRDALGNVTEIVDALDPASSRSYGYQEHQSYLTRADGPWGSLRWTYDRSGNRLTETRDGSTTSYTYLANAAQANSPRLASTLSGEADASPVSYGYDVAGNLTHESRGSSKLRYRYDAQNRLTEIRRDAAGQTDAVSRLVFDGRGYLARSTLTTSGASERRVTRATYDSDGLLLHRRVESFPTPQTPRATPSLESDVYLLYFDERPVAQLSVTPGPNRELTFLSTNHLGSPVLATDVTGAVVWSGGFEPFAADDSGAGQAGIFLRFPGQWHDETWAAGSGFYHNVNRWYDAPTGRYTTPDPLSPVDTATFSGRSPFHSALEQAYGYADMNPLARIDPLGLRSRVCCQEIPKIPGVHCAIEIERDGIRTTCGLHGSKFSPGEEKGVGRVRKDKGFDFYPNKDKTKCGPWNEDCGTDECVIKTAREYTNPSQYRAVRGPNSNTFARRVADACDLVKPEDAGWTRGWTRTTPAPPEKERDHIPSECSLP